MLLEEEAQKMKHLFEHSYSIFQKLILYSAIKPTEHEPPAT